MKDLKTKEFDLENYYLQKIEINRGYKLLGYPPEKEKAEEIRERYFLERRRLSKLYFKLEKEYEDNIIEPIRQKYKQDCFRAEQLNHLEVLGQDLKIYGLTGYGLRSAHKRHFDNEEERKKFEYLIEIRKERIKDIQNSFKGRTKSIKNPNFGDIRSFFQHSKPSQKSFSDLVSLLSEMKNKDELEMCLNYSRSHLDKNYKPIQRKWSYKYYSEVTLLSCVVDLGPADMGWFLQNLQKFSDKENDILALRLSTDSLHSVYYSNREIDNFSRSINKGNLVQDIFVYSINIDEDSLDSLIDPEKQNEFSFRFTNSKEEFKERIKK